jgi:hypothetical protein
MKRCATGWHKVSNTFYIIGTVAGPHPYPMMVRDFQSVIGRESIAQMLEQCGRQPDVVIACVGGGSNAMGIFHPYIPVPGVRLIGVEAAGDGIATGHHAASLTAGRPGVLHGNRTYLLQDENGQIIETHSISAGLDYPGVGPEHAWLKDSGRAEYVRPSPMPRRCRPFTICAASKASSRRSNRAMPSPTPAKLAPTCRKTRSCWSTSPVVVTRICTPLPKNRASFSEVLTMSKIQAVFERLQAQGRKALIPFITAGDPPGADRSLAAFAGPRRRRHHRTWRAVLRSRWPMGQPSSGLPSELWPRASACAKCSRWWPTSAPTTTTRRSF